MLRAFVQGLTIVLLVAILGCVLVVVLAVGSLLNVSGAVGGRLGGVGSGVGTVVTGAQQALQDAADPNHPPRGLVYDTEFGSLQVFHSGDGLPGGTTYVLTVQAIKRRENAESPDTALYASIHAQLRQPRETRVLGQLVRSDADAHDYALYKGESFRIGRTVYRVNWVSDTEGSLAVASYRHPDGVTAPLKFDYE